MRRLALALTALACAWTWTSTAAAQPAEREKVELIIKAGDPAGVQFARQFRTEVARSEVFVEAPDDEALYWMRITTTELIPGDKTFTLFSVALGIHNATLTPEETWGPDYYATSFLGSCGVDDAASCAQETLKVLADFLAKIPAN